MLDPDEGREFTVVYRFNDRMAYAKKVHIKAFIRDREYELQPPFAKARAVPLPVQWIARSELCSQASRIPCSS